MTATTEPKFCKDCRHFTEASSVMGFHAPAKCTRPSNMSVPDPVRGLSHPMSEPAELRSIHGNCGKDGNWFEAKPPEPAPEPKPLLPRECYVLQKPWPFPEKEPEPPKTPRWKVWLARVMGL